MCLSPRAWAGETVAILGAGPSLTRDQIAHVEAAGVRCICINDAYRLAPWADVLYACDGRWWEAHAGAPEFNGAKYALEPRRAKDGPPFADVTLLRNTGDRGFDPEPTAVRTGHNSGYQAVHLAAHYGAARVILLGYDMRAIGARVHFDGYDERWPVTPPFALFRECFDTLAPELAARGVEVLNATPGSALQTFPLVALEEALARVAR